MITGLPIEKRIKAKLRANPSQLSCVHIVIITDPSRLDYRQGIKLGLANSLSQNAVHESIWKKCKENELSVVVMTIIKNLSNYERFSSLLVAKRSINLDVLLLKAIMLKVAFY
jgi:hypothetical protein